MAQSFYTPRTIQSGQVPSSQSNFPALVLLNDTRYKTTSYTGGHVANTNGYDIRFYSDSALTTALTFELVTYNASAGTGEFWVLLPTCDVAVTIYIGYGDASLNANASSTSTWGSQYVMVQHLPNGTTLSANDSTVNTLNGTLFNTPTATTGQIDGGASLNGSNQYIGRTAGFPTSWTTFSFSIWFNATARDARLLIMGSQNNRGPGIYIITDIQLLQRGIALFEFTSAVVSTGKQYYVKVTRNGTTANVHLYNLTAATSVHQTITISGSFDGGDGGYFLGRGDSGAYYFGMLDEARVSTLEDSQNQTDAEYNNQSNNPAFWPDGTEVQITGPQFDAASNSGDQAASANYTFNRTVSGTNRFLIVSVELLTVTGATVTSVTDDDGGGNVALSFIGAKSTITGAGRVEMWGLPAPATGTKAIRVILSASIESVATAISYTNVHQVTPTEAFNSAQATNAGSATNASVTVTSVTDNCRIVAACVANDTSITAGQTSRNNVSGTLGSGADEDNNAAVSPAGATTMTYTGMGITTTWAIVGVAVKPYALPTGGLFRVSSLNGVGVGGPFFQNPVN